MFLVEKTESLQVISFLQKKTFSFIDEREEKTWFLQLDLAHPVEGVSTGESVSGGGAKETGPICLVA